MQEQQPTFPLEEIIKNFNIDGEYIGYYLSNDGHINNTFVLEFDDGLGKIKSYLLQLINTNVFKNPDELMENIVGVTEHLRKIVVDNGGDPERECLNVYFTSDGKPYYRDADGNCWRCYNFITGAHSCQSIDDPETFANAARAFGKFQCLLADYPSETLHETIPNFHNTLSRFADFEKAVSDNIAGRADSVRDEIDFVLARRDDAGVLVKLLEKGKLPLRVTHNDTKLNNVMFDNETDEGICVIDLDTVMPGLSLYDFGDSIRFGANTAAEDEKDLSKVSLSLPLYREYTAGYLSTAGQSLTPTEVEYLPFSAKLMTFECGMRFLTDYLNGDTYFRIAYDDHNLDRCRTQFRLVEDMERKMEDMKAITQEIYSRIKK
ncbi:MAG: aminoglycoside phosphotransferase family protein [Oscillospiraceae bacterium]|nr:aminoglycoside phosphotransferase family protein [Oscillospiraceae bacterium]